MLLISSFASLSLQAQNSDNDSIALSGLADRLKGGVIDWENQMMYADGEGAMPSAEVVPNRAVALLKAKDYAKMAAIANLLMLIQGTTISYEGYGQDYMLKDSLLKQKIEGYVKNVSILKTETYKISGNTIVKVTVGTPIFGKDTPGTAFMDKIATINKENQGKKPVAVPLIELPIEKHAVKLEQSADAGRSPIWPKQIMTADGRLWIDTPNKLYSSPASARPVDPSQQLSTFKQEGPFTSVIIDTRGYDVLRAICPKIRKSDGTEVWGTVDVSADFAIEEGIAAYAKTLESARDCRRCGDNPLIISVIGRAGGKAMCDAIISNEDAVLMLDENKKTKFLDKFNVIFVSNPQK